VNCFSYQDVVRHGLEVDRGRRDSLLVCHKAVSQTNTNTHTHTHFHKTCPFSPTPPSRTGTTLWKKWRYFHLTLNKDGSPETVPIIFTQPIRQAMPTPADLHWRPILNNSSHIKSGNRRKEDHTTPHHTPLTALHLANPDPWCDRAALEEPYTPQSWQENLTDTQMKDRYTTDRRQAGHRRNDRYMTDSQCSISFYW